VGRDASRDQDGDQAAWRDLVARLELPPGVDPAHPPWPDRENLDLAATWPAEASRPASEPESEDDRSHGAVGRSAAGKNPNPADEPGPGEESGPGSDSASRTQPPATHGRVIKPARSLRYSIPPDGQSPGTADEVIGRVNVPGGSGIPPERDLASGWNFRAVSRPADEVPASGNPSEAGTHADLGWLEPDDEVQNGDDRYIPPAVPPLPKLDPVARGAWTALVGGPGYLLIATTLSWQIPGWAELAAIIAFVAGFVVLVSRLGDGPSRRDGPDQGAMVLVPPAAT
jgi:hypothetical protein